VEELLAHCSALFSARSGVLAGFFLGGLAGSITHCIAMCGPVVVGHVACGGCSGVAAATQWEYHLGRMLTYGALGFVASMLGKLVSAFAFWPQVASVMLVVAGVLFIASSLRVRRPACGTFSGGQFLRGALMGFMPCGLIYAALMVAATLAHPLLGMLAMWLFVLGTVPVLCVAGGSAAWLARRWNDYVVRAGRVAMAFNGLSLLVLATKMMR
jgi:uncharacterized protein